MDTFGRVAVQPTAMWQTVVKTHCSQGPTQGWAPQNPGGCSGRGKDMVMVILCRRSLADKGAGTRKDMARGGNRKASGYIWVGLTPGRTAEVRGQSTQQGFFLRAKRLLGRGWTWKEKDIRAAGLRRDWRCYRQELCGPSNPRQGCWQEQARPERRS